MTSRKRTFFSIVLAAAAVAAVLAVFGFFYSRRPLSEQKEETNPIRATAFKLNTVVTITLYDSQDSELLDEALSLCDYYEAVFSRTFEESELFRLNHRELPKDGDAFLLSDSLAELTEIGLYYTRLSEGAFDVSVAPVSSLWDFTSGEKKVPDEALIEEALPHVGFDHVLLDGKRLTFTDEHASLDLGAVAKGYIADQIKEYLVSQGVQSAIIDLGGNVLCIGNRPDGEPFRIGIQKPFAGRSETVGTVEISGRSVVSSGIYERYFEKENVLYHHILNPKTGYPYDNGLLSVTIISDKSVDGDGLSTSCFALGLEKGMELIDSLENVQAVFITSDGELHFSQDFSF